MRLKDLNISPITIINKIIHDEIWLKFERFFRYMIAYPNDLKRNFKFDVPLENYFKFDFKSFIQVFVKIILNRIF
jgi:hypothetical protein